MARRFTVLCLQTLLGTAHCTHPHSVQGVFEYPPSANKPQGAVSDGAFYDIYYYFGEGAG